MTWRALFVPGRFTRALQQPARLMGAGSRGGSGQSGSSGGAAEAGTTAVGSVLVAALVSVQLFLEVASRRYAEDFAVRPGR